MMEVVNGTVVSLQRIVDSINVYRNTVTKEELILSKLKNELKNFFESDFVWINNDDPNYQIKKQLTDALTELFEKYSQKEIETNKRIEWDHDKITLSSQLWRQTHIEFVLNADTYKFNLVNFFYSNYNNPCYHNVKIDETVDYTIEEVVKFALANLEY